MSLGDHVRFVWQVLNKPILGTEARTPVIRVRIPGRISDRALVAIAVVLALGLAADMAGWINFSAINPFKRYLAWANTVICELGWWGYSKGMLANAAMFFCLTLLPAWFMVGLSWRKTGQLIRTKTNMPADGRPWFSIQLIEGAAAVRQGKQQRIALFIVAVVMVWITFWIFPDILKIFLVSPRDLKVCQ